MEIPRCIVCGKDIVFAKRLRRYCSPSCYAKNYRKRPGVREVLYARRRNWLGHKKIIEEYKFLIKLKKLTVKQMRRLEVLGDYLGRDIEEYVREKKNEKGVTVLYKVRR